MSGLTWREPGLLGEGETPPESPPSPAESWCVVRGVHLFMSSEESPLQDLTSATDLGRHARRANSRGALDLLPTSGLP